MCGQKSADRVERERERMKIQIECVPHLFITMVKEEGIGLTTNNVDGIFSIIQQRIDTHLLTTEAVLTFSDWHFRRNKVAEVIRRLEARK